MRESPALDVMGLLHARGARGVVRRSARARSARPRVVGTLRHQGGRRRPRIASAQYDCIVVITDHKAFDYDAMVAEADLIVDTRNAIKKPAQNVFGSGAPRPEGETVARA